MSDASNESPTYSQAQYDALEDRWRANYRELRTAYETREQDHAKSFAEREAYHTQRFQALVDEHAASTSERDSYWRARHTQQATQLLDSHNSNLNAYHELIKDEARRWKDFARWICIPGGMAIGLSLSPLLVYFTGRCP